MFGMLGVRSVKTSTYSPSRMVFSLVYDQKDWYILLCPPAVRVILTLSVGQYRPSGLFFNNLRS